MPVDDRIVGCLRFHPLTQERWADFEGLFGTRGAYGGGWCMWWRATRREFEERGGEGNRRAMKALLRSGQVPGILAYRGDEALGWCSVAPRKTYGALERSPVLRRLDDRPVWSIVCLYVARGCRGRGVAGALIRAAVEHVRRHGAQVVEAYPSAARSRPLPPRFQLHGNAADVRPRRIRGAGPTFEERAHHALRDRVAARPGRGVNHLLVRDSVSLKGSTGPRHAS